MWLGDEDYSAPPRAPPYGPAEGGSNLLRANLSNLCEVLIIALKLTDPPQGRVC